MIALRNLILAGVALVILAGVAVLAYAQTGSDEVPPDVAAFVSRRASCSEWSKRAIDAEQAARIDVIYSNLESLKCFDLLGDAQALQKKYPGNPEILASLGMGHTFTRFVTRLPVQNAVPPALDR